MSHLLSFLRACPLLDRDKQGAFQVDEVAFVGSVRSFSHDNCKVDAEGHPQYPVGYWHLPPEQHLLELLIFNAIFLPLVWWLLQQPVRVEIPALPTELSGARFARARARAHHWALVALDGACTALVWVTGLLTVYLKFRPDCMGRLRLAYLVQPCHLSNFILCALSLLTPATAATTRLFEFYLVTVFGALLALATPDVRGLDWMKSEALAGMSASLGLGEYLDSWEKVSFFTQHTLLVVVPAVWIARRRFSIAQPPTANPLSCITMWALLSVAHWDFFAPLSYLTGHNVNYMLVPPNGLLFQFGRWYRLFMLLGCLPLSFLMRMGKFSSLPAPLLSGSKSFFFSHIFFFVNTPTLTLTLRRCAQVLTWLLD